MRSGTGSGAAAVDDAHVADEAVERLRDELFSLEAPSIHGRPVLPMPIASVNGTRWLSEPSMYMSMKRPSLTTATCDQRLVSIRWPQLVVLSPRLSGQIAHCSSAACGEVELHRGLLRIALRAAEVGAGAHLAEQAHPAVDLAAAGRELEDGLDRVAVLERHLVDRGGVAGLEVRAARRARAAGELQGSAWTARRCGGRRRGRACRRRRASPGSGRCRCRRRRRRRRPRSSAGATGRPSRDEQLVGGDLGGLGGGAEAGVEVEREAEAVLRVGLLDHLLHQRGAVDDGVFMTHGEKVETSIVLRSMSNA